MRNFLAKYKNVLLLSVLAVVCTSFFLYVLLLLGDYNAGVNEQARYRAEFYAAEQTHYVQGQGDDLSRATEYAADKLSSCTTQAELIEELQRSEAALRGDDFLGAFYAKDDVLYDEDGAVAWNYTAIKDDLQTETTTLSHIFYYKNQDPSFAVVVKTDSPLVDAFVTVYKRSALSLSAALDEERGSEFVLLCRHDGQIVEKLVHGDTFTIDNEPIQDGLLKTLFNDNSDWQRVCAAFSEAETQSFIFQKGSSQYVLTVTPFGTSYGETSLVCAYKVSTIYGEGFTVMQSIYAALLSLTIVIVVAAGALLVTKLAEKRKIFRLEMEVPFLQCATVKKFENEADELLKRHPRSSFALVSLQIDNYGYVVDCFGEESAKQLSKYVADTLRRTLYLEETFGYAQDGEFVLLLHYRERQGLAERLNGTYMRLSSFNGFGDGAYKVGASFAVYEVEREEKQTVKQMLDKLYIAKESATSQNASVSIGYYDDVMRKRYMKKAEIEGKMEQALKNSEFHLFYQPKYNLKAKNLDGCEILVRWYDAALEKYHLPAEFLPVFEENGFIVKLDHFVFYKACENIAKRIENRQICYPISVNVSRITAIQSDFTDYYVRIKKKFDIKDNFITLEFTESFAYENYEFLRNIVDTMHANGLLCSIDDFGTGYSSYNILKTIAMDEIKLDKFFLGKGLTAERDQTLLESVIGMVKKLGMKVTQEGVETEEDLFRLDALGCDVIQGYYFAKPMKYSDYCTFVDKNFT